MTENTSRCGAPARDRKTPARPVRRKQPDAITRISLKPEEIRLHPEAAAGFSAWRDVPRVGHSPEVARRLAQAAVETGLCLAIRAEGAIHIVAGFDVADAAARHNLPLEVLVLPEGALEPHVISRRALGALALMPATQLDPVFGHAAWVAAIRRWMPEPLTVEWLGAPVTRSSAARLLGVCRDRLAADRLGRPS